MTAVITPPLERESAYSFQLGLIPTGEEKKFQVPVDEELSIVEAISAFDTIYDHIERRGRERKAIHLGRTAVELTRFGHYNYMPVSENDRQPPLYIVRSILVQGQKWQQTLRGARPYLEADCIISPADGNTYAETHLRPPTAAGVECDVEPFGQNNFERFKLLPKVADVLTNFALR